MGNAQDRWHVGPKFLSMPILHPCNLEEWYPSISIDWQVLVCGTERINHRTKMTFNRVSFDLKAPVTYLLVVAEVLCCIPNAIWTLRTPCRSTWNPQGNRSHPKTGAGTSPVGRKEKMLTLTISSHPWKRKQLSGSVLGRSEGGRIVQWWLGWAHQNPWSSRLKSMQAPCTEEQKHLCSCWLSGDKFEKCFFYCSGSMCPFQHTHERAAPCLKHISLNLSPQ